MDIWDHTPQTYQYGQISSAKSNSSIDHLGNPSKRDSAYGSFSTSSSTPDHTLSSVDGLSTENVMYKVGHWETPKQGNSKTVSFLSDNGRFEEKVNSFETPPQHENSLNSRLEDHTNSVYSGAGRSNFVPVWYVPEGKKSPSPPPPPPPLRSDSFAATKSHDRDHAPPLYSEGIQSPQHFEVLHRTPIRNDWSADTAEEQKQMIRSVEKTSHIRRGSSPIQRPDFIPDYDTSSPGDRINNNMGHAKRLHSSLSSTDVRFAQSIYESRHHQHQRQYSDEYSFFHNPKASASSKEPKWLSSYSDIKERPSDKHNCHLNQTKIPSNTTTAVSDMTSEENPELNHYYCVKARQQPVQSAQGTSKSLQFKNERRNSGTGNLAASVSSENPAITMSQNPKYSLPQHLNECSLDICEKRAHCVVNKGEDIKAVVLEGSRKVNYSEKSGQNKTFEENLSSHEYKDGQEYFQVSDTKIAQKDFKWNQEKNYHISPQKTPMLHSLAQEEKKQINVAAEIGINKQTGFDVHLSKNARRSDRFATTLRNEIQMKRAKLQKSKSTAALIEPTEEEDYTENWKHDSQEKTASSSESCYSHMYKDNLKEAQARVLKATSFQRRDLEPNSADYLPDRKSNIYNTSPLTFVSEDELGFPEFRQSSKEISLSNGAHHFSRIGARKRFTAEQKLKSYSEPEKINEVGMLDDNCQTHHRPTTSEEALETFADKWKFFEETSKPVCQKSSQTATPRRNSHEIESGGSLYEKRMRSASFGVENVLCASDRPSETVHYSSHITKSRQPQRLETFAEYQASWKEQRKPIENCSSGKYHSADNILDAGLEQLEKSQYKHERSRSSPSTDFYKQVNIFYNILLYFKAMKNKCVYMCVRPCTHITDIMIRAKFLSL